jgi:pimeloyl-ACP methyl ester carboxylesterase
MFESRFVHAADGVRLHVRLHRSVLPTSTTCVLLHGFGEGSYVWEETCKALRNICTTAAVDLRGHGDSEYPAAATYAFDNHVFDIRAIIDRLALTRFMVAGHSFGGEIALRVAAHPPAQLLGAIFIDIAPTVDQEVSKQATVQMQQMLRPYRSVEEYSSLLMSMRPLLGESTAQQLARGALRECDAGLRLKLDPALMTCADEQFTSPARWQELLPMIRCPALVMRGSASAMVSASSAKEMVRMLARGELVTIPGAGHAVLSDNPAASSAAIARFADATLRGSRS